MSLDFSLIERENVGCYHCLARTGVLMIAHTFANSGDHHGVVEINSTRLSNMFKQFQLIQPACARGISKHIS